MVRRSLVVILTALAVLASVIVTAQDLPAIPALTARVTDTADVLSAQEQAGLETKLAAFERNKGAQIAILLVKTTRPESIEQFSIRVAETWKLGRKGIDDGALLVIAMADRTLRIEVGYGLEGALTDATAKRIVSEVILPHFKQGRHFDGINAGVDTMMSVIGSEALPAPFPNTLKSEFSLPEASMPVLLGLVLVIGGVLRAIFGRFIASSIIASVAGFIAWFVASSLTIAAIVAIIAFILTLSGGRNGVGLGSGGFSGRGGGSSSGGFSGGGGGFGGGGASGRW